jgi:hypothetical protein
MVKICYESYPWIRAKLEQSKILTRKVWVSMGGWKLPGGRSLDGD